VQVACRSGSNALLQSSLDVVLQIVQRKGFKEVNKVSKEKNQVRWQRCVALFSTATWSVVVGGGCKGVILQLRRVSARVHPCAH
jgi:hypothetical protein